MYPHKVLHKKNYLNFKFEKKNCFRKLFRQNSFWFDYLKFSFHYKIQLLKKGLKKTFLRMLPYLLRTF